MRVVAAVLLLLTFVIVSIALLRGRPGQGTYKEADDRDRPMTEWAEERDELGDDLDDDVENDVEDDPESPHQSAPTAGP
jgi:hypothetical protein